MVRRSKTGEKPTKAPAKKPTKTRKAPRSDEADVPLPEVKSVVPRTPHDVSTFTPADPYMVYLQEFARKPIHSDALAVAGITMMDVRIRLETDVKFKKLFRYAQEDGYQALEDEAIRRALVGWDEDVYQMGQFVGTIHKFSDKLLERTLTGNIAKYRNIQREEERGLSKEDREEMDKVFEELDFADDDR